MDWKILFEPHILKRGYNYYMDSAVLDFTKKKSSIAATVEGTMPYRVRISFNRDGDINHMYCSCPYAKDGNNCKHMAAVLYEWEEYALDCALEDEEEDEDVFTSEDKQKMIRETLSLASSQSIQDFLVNELMEDDNLLIRFMKRVGVNNKENLFTLYTLEMDQIIEKYTGYSEFASGYDSVNLAYFLTNFVYEHVESQMASQSYDLSFAMLVHVFEKLDDLDVEDVVGLVDEFLEYVSTLLIRIIHLSSMEQKRNQIQWIQTFLKKSPNGPCSYFVENVLFEGFPQEDFLQEHLAIAKQQLEYVKKKEGTWHYRKDVERWITYCLSILSKMEDGQEDMEAFRKENWTYTPTRIWFSRYYMNQGNYKKALQILDEDVDWKKDVFDGLRKYHEIRKEIYHDIGDTKNYKEELWMLAFHYNIGNLSIFKELKNAYSTSEWLQKREELYEKIANPTVLCSFYCEEKQYDKLLECVLKSIGLNLMERYVDVLMEQYPTEVLEKYKRELRAMARNASNRRGYRALVNVLRTMYELKGGKPVAQELVDEFKRYYRGRPAMMEELNELKNVSV